MHALRNWKLVRAPFAIIALLFLLDPRPVLSQVAVPREIVLGKVHILHSTILNQDRPYWVYLPPSYSSSVETERTFPVLYLLDGGAHFNVTSGIVHHLSAATSDVLAMPETIIVALPNMGRTHNMTPAHIDSGAFSENSGGAPQFLAFLRDELMPEIQAHYRVTQERTIVGHSLAGLFALNVLLTAPETFTHYIAVDPGLFWGDAYLVRKIRDWRPVDTGLSLTVYIAQGNSPLSDYEDKSLKKAHESAIRSFRKLLEARKGKNVRTGFDYFPNEGHRSVVLPALWQGLVFSHKHHIPPHP